MRVKRLTLAKRKSMPQTGMLMGKYIEINIGRYVKGKSIKSNKKTSLQLTDRLEGKSIEINIPI
jgi:hypothetical protein